MNLTLLKKREPVNGGLNRLRDEMDRTFDRFFGEPMGFADPKAFRYEGWLPPLDVSETDNELTIRAETPGMGVKDLEISLTGYALSIAGKKEEQQEKKGEDFYQCERRFGTFRRIINLPETIDPANITAESDNGLLTIRLAKKPGAKPKTIEVKPVSKKVAVTV